MSALNIQAAVRAMIEQQLQRRGIHDNRVLEAMASVPRHRFISDVDPMLAYADRALPTAEGQTISQPYMVALMSESLNVHEGTKVLEVGTGSGYQTAILVALGATVVSIERNHALVDRAQRILEELKLSTAVTIVLGDGTIGCTEHAPYDRILVTAGASHLPHAYPNQLVAGGRIVVPIGDRRDQHLMIFDDRDGKLSRFRSISCRFVPLIGQNGWSDGDD